MVANFPDGPPADFATRPAGRQETEDAKSPIRDSHLDMRQWEKGPNRRNRPIV